MLVICATPRLSLRHALTIAQNGSIARNTQTKPVAAHRQFVSNALNLNIASLVAIPYRATARNVLPGHIAWTLQMTAVLPCLTIARDAHCGATALT